MPIDYSRYPANWRDIRAAILQRAANTCEWCGAENHEPHPVTGARVVLTVAHINHDIENNAPGNLAALCQRCHQRHDYEVVVVALPNLVKDHDRKRTRLRIMF